MKPAVDEMFPEGAGPYVDLDEVRRAAAGRAAAGAVGTTKPRRSACAPLPRRVLPEPESGPGPRLSVQGRRRRPTATGAPAARRRAASRGRVAGAGVRAGARQVTGGERAVPGLRRASPADLVPALPERGLQRGWNAAAAGEAARSPGPGRAR